MVLKSDNRNPGELHSETWQRVNDSETNEHPLSPFTQHILDISSGLEQGKYLTRTRTDMDISNQLVS